MTIAYKINLYIFVLLDYTSTQFCLRSEGILSRIYFSIITKKMFYLNLWICSKISIHIVVGEITGMESYLHQSMIRKKICTL